MQHTQVFRIGDERKKKTHTRIIHNKIDNTIINEAIKMETDI